MTGPQHGSRSDSSESAVRAAARLPRPRTPTGEPYRTAPRYVVGRCAVCVGVAGWCLGLAAFVIPWSWLSTLGGLPVWLLVRTAFFSIRRGTETGLVAVDRAGTVHVLRGARSVLRLRHMFDDGPRQWMRASSWAGFAFVLVYFGIPTALTVVLDNPAPLVLLLAVPGWAFLDLTRYLAVTAVELHRSGLEPLDGVVMLPLLALYGRHYGWPAAVGEVPADRLEVAWAAHPEDAWRVVEYLARRGASHAFAQVAGRLPGGPGPS